LIRCNARNRDIGSLVHLVASAVAIITVSGREERPQTPLFVAGRVFLRQKPQVEDGGQ
jgi:hypothetical protein